MKISKTCSGTKCSTCSVITALLINLDTSIRCPKWLPPPLLPRLKERCGGPLRRNAERDDEGERGEYEDDEFRLYIIQ